LQYPVRRGVFIRLLTFHTRVVFTVITALGFCEHLCQHTSFAGRVEQWRYVLQIKGPLGCFIRCSLPLTSSALPTNWRVLPCMYLWNDAFAFLSVEQRQKQ